jgi:hypothetical protein
MPQDPRTIVRSSDQLWSDQVGIIEASEALDAAGPGVPGLARLIERQQPVIYEFYGGRRKFVAPKNPYA